MDKSWCDRCGSDVDNADLVTGYYVDNEQTMVYVGPECEAAIEPDLLPDRQTLPASAVVNWKFPPLTVGV